MAPDADPTSSQASRPLSFPLRGTADAMHRETSSPRALRHAARALSRWRARPIFHSLNIGHHPLLLLPSFPLNSHPSSDSSPARPNGTVLSIHALPRNLEHNGINATFMQWLELVHLPFLSGNNHVRHLGRPAALSTAFSQAQTVRFIPCTGPLL
jgi:hypothetical protein